MIVMIEVVQFVVLVVWFLLVDDHDDDDGDDHDTDFTCQFRMLLFTGWDPLAGWLDLQVKSQEEAASSFNRAVYGTVQKGSAAYKALEAGPASQPAWHQDRDDSLPPTHEIAWVYAENSSDRIVMEQLTVKEHIPSTLRLKLRPPNLKPSSDFHPPIVVARPRPNSYTAQPQVVATKHMDTVAFTFRESSENQVQYLDEAKGEPVKYTGGKLDSASLDEWVNGLLLKSEPGQTLNDKIFSRFLQGNFRTRN